MLQFIIICYTVCKILQDIILSANKQYSVEIPCNVNQLNVWFQLYLNVTVSLRTALLGISLYIFDQNENTISVDLNILNTFINIPVTVCNMPLTQDCKHAQHKLQLSTFIHIHLQNTFPHCFWHSVPCNTRNTSHKSQWTLCISVGIKNMLHSSTVELI
jgi:hypothetical protein